jgi:hypothetical protein
VNSIQRLNLKTIEGVLAEAKDFYIKKFGFIQEIPTSLLNESHKLQMIKQTEQIEALTILDILPEEQGLF